MMKYVLFAMLLVSASLVRADELELAKHEQLMVEQCNEFRARCGLPALKPAKWLMQRARQHTTTMVNARSMFHSSFGLRENVAVGQSSPASVTRTWEFSSGHRANMASGELFIGVAGYVDPSGTPYWTQVFSSSEKEAVYSVGGSSIVAGNTGGAINGMKKIIAAPLRLIGRFRRQ